MPRPQEFPGRPLLVTLSVALSACLAPLLALPTSASAYATIEGPPVFSSAPGLPDGRVYEQVSPADKNGNEAGATSNPIVSIKARPLAAADGNSVLFGGTGAMGESPWGASGAFVASKNRSGPGWSTRAVLPRAQESLESLGGNLYVGPFYLDPSADLSHVMFEANHGTFAAPPDSLCVGDGENVGEGQLYLSGPDPFVPATWLDRPEAAGAVENCAQQREAGAPVGGTPDFSTVYFAFPGTLLPEDASRAPHAEPKAQIGYDEDVEAWGFYEDREGTVREAGVLPDGGLDPFGAVPAASGHGSAPAGSNQVSADGSQAFFVSPDPASCAGAGLGGENNCAVDPPELYVRENGARTLLVSRDTLAPEAGGLPAPAPAGVSKMLNPTGGAFFMVKAHGSYVFASPDGSQAFFQSTDALTEAARQVSPGSEPKTYDFDVGSGALTYLPNVVGQILATDTNGSSFAFVRPESGGAPAELDLWSAAPGGGSVTPVTQLPGGGFEPVRMSSDGSVVLFTTSGLPGFNDLRVTEVFRYDAASNTLGCVSCAPAGVTSLPASIAEGNGGNVSDDDRVFFQTQAPLVPQDTNTNSPEVEVRQETFEKQGMDVYEWESGVVYLVSGGKSLRDSYLMDSSENGDDVFFATEESLVAGDTDGGYDVYDARVPHPGDNPPPAAVPCEGSVCQGPPRVPSPLAAPASAAFSGLGNPTSEVTPSSPPMQTTTKAVKCPKGKKLVRGKCVKVKSGKKRAKKASNNRRGK